MLHKLAKPCLQNKRITFPKKHYVVGRLKKAYLKRAILIRTNQEITSEANQHLPTKEKMPIYTCCCGIKILIIPDLSAMNKAIKNHVNKHKELTGSPIRYEYIVEKIIETLSEYYSDSTV